MEPTKIYLEDGQSSCNRTTGKEPKRVARLVIDESNPDKAIREDSRFF